MNDFISINSAHKEYTAIYIHAVKQKFSTIPIVAWGLKISGDAEGLVLKNADSSSGLVLARLGRDKEFDFVGILQTEKIHDPGQYLQFCKAKYPEALAMLEEKLAEPKVKVGGEFNRVKMEFYSEA